MNESAITEQLRTGVVVVSHEDTTTLTSNPAADQILSEAGSLDQIRTLDGTVSLMSAALASANGEPTVDGVFRYHRGTDWRYVRASVHTQDKAGALIELVRVDAPEAGDRGLAEHLQRLEYAASLTTDEFWDWDLRTHELRLSEAWYRSLGFEPFEIPQLHESWENLVHPDDLQATWEALNRYLAGQTATYEFINRLRRKDGTYRWNHDSGRVVEWDEAGKPARMVGIDRNIDEQQQLVAQLRDSQRLESIGTLANGIAHDFNNILSPILILAELAREHLDDRDQVSAWLGDINAAADRAKNLVLKLMRLSRQSEDELRPVVVSEVAIETLSLVERTLPPNVQLSCEISGSYAVLCDPVNLEHILLNLCNNAGFATEGKGATVKVTISDEVFTGTNYGPRRALSPGDDVVEIVVEDNGVGIEPHHLESIFEAYFSTKGSSSSDSLGSGLGLTVVHGLVESYGGSIAVESVVGQGSTFRVVLPRTLLDPAEAAEQRKSAALSNHRVLFVEDDEANRDALSAGLRLTGLSVTCCSDGPEALQTFRENPDAYDIVVSDLIMPKLNGDKLAAEIKELRPELPFIIVSGYGQRHADTKPVDAWLSKPATVVDVVYLIRSLLFAQEANPAAQ